MDEKTRRAYYKRYKNFHHKNQASSNKRKKYLILAIILFAVIFLIINIYQKKEEKQRKTIENLLLTALEPVGSTMYIWGGGWGDEDISSGAGAVRIGVSPRWAEFAEAQDNSYDFEETRFQRLDGLDCSGYIGWCVYNVMESRSGKEGYVVKATCMALDYAMRGWGDFTVAGEVREWRAGDVMSMDGHVWMVVGTCADGSVVFLHSTPPGVSLGGTLLADGLESEATKLAEEYMSTYFPKWYERYPDYRKPYSYLTDSASMSWNRETLSDEAGLTKMSAEEVLEWLFEKIDKF